MSNRPDIVFASFEEVEKVLSERQCVSFVWPDEGAFNAKGKWEFNEAHRGEYEPLLMDLTTAGVIVGLYNALEDVQNKAKLDYWVGLHRGNFARIVQLAWDATKKAA